MKYSPLGTSETSHYREKSRNSIPPFLHIYTKAKSLPEPLIRNLKTNKNIEEQFCLHSITF